MYDRNLNLKVSEEWNKFTTTGFCDSKSLRPIIYDSWIRSKNYNVNPNNLKEQLLTESDLKKRISKCSDLVTVAQPYIDNIYSFVKNSGFVVYLTDEDGYVLYLAGDDEIIKSSNNVSKLCVGANRSERYSGTNAIGTCLAINKPIQIYGSEHYVKHHQSYTCSAAPIHNEGNKIIGCLDITGKVYNVHSHTLGMIVAAVDGIEKELKINNAYNKMSIMKNQLSTTLNSINTAIIVVSKVGTILNINKSASDIFNIDSNCINKRINDVLEYDKRILNFEHLDKNYMDAELEIKNTNYSITTANYSNKYDQIEGTVISFREMKRIHKMVKRISGFTATYTVNNLIGQSSQINYVKSLCLKASKSISNVLILGESGTGKELVAQSIHNASFRRNEPFIAINCGALPKGLIESELFGYEGGAFTGANKEGKPGKFELADGGTIFLDEIGDMPLDTQVNLLRVLQDKEIVRIGGSKPKPIDIRVIAATNKNLLKSIQNNSFREDLYYRLNVFTINVPPLRERNRDIQILAEHFINYYNKTLNKNVIKIDKDALEAFKKYSWPGNIRELENIIERAINIVETNVITVKDLPSLLQKLVLENGHQKETIICGELDDTNIGNNNNDYYNEDLSDKKMNFEKDELIRALTINNGNAVKSSQLLGISRRTLYRKLDKYNISIDSFR